MLRLSLILALLTFCSSGNAIAASPDAPDSTGTAFFVSGNGVAVTNHHVVEQCKRIVLFDPQAGWAAEAQVVAVDKANDLALLRADVKSRPLPVADSFALKRGEDVLTLGYPSPGIQGTRQKATFGKVNADSGIGDDIRHVQVDVPVQPGNSGGPLLNARGEVVGVINARLRGDFQNVGYAIKADYLRPLLNKASVKTSASSSFASSSVAAVVERCQDSVVMVLGYRTTKPAGPGAKRAQSESEDEPPDLAETQRAAEQGDVDAQYILGVMYAMGHGVAKNDAKAVEWYRKAAEQGLALAQNDLGFMYDMGQGVAKDYVKAVEWYSKAAEQGLAVAQYILGLMYAMGRGVTKSDVKAVEWYRKAAEQGDADAQCDLGIGYAIGRGVAKSDAKAVE
jgi:hypothetical protein